MASDTDDSEGEERELVRLSLIQELRNVLDEYPDDGQIFKELIQNAEDARAGSVKIVTDTRCFHRDLDAKTLEKHPHLQYLQGPALCVYNDAVFSTSDWKGITMLHQSVKEKDPLKVGRFGLGFKSVFHLTDRLVILSGNVIMYMDPFKDVKRCFVEKSVLGRKGRELLSLLYCLENLFGISKQTFEETGGIPGTVFWLPLRQTPSELSSTVYTKERVDNLLAAFRTEASSMLLFLNSIECVQLYSRNDARDFLVEVTFAVKIADDCLEKVRQEKQTFVASVRDGGDALPQSSFDCVTEVTTETTDYVNPSTVREKWLVTTLHAGQRDISRQMSELCSALNMSYRPCVGVAAPLGQADFNSQVFCFLPLPLDTRSPTGLPVHVHGYFALSQNRRHLKWPSADQLSHRETLEAPMRWNCLLVEEPLPMVYCIMLKSLKELHLDTPAEFYAAWPDTVNVEDRWRPMLRPVYTALAQQPVFHTPAKGGLWITLSEAVLQRFDADLLDRLKLEMSAKEEKEHGVLEVLDTVVKVYSLTGQNLVKLPDNVLETLDQLALLNTVKVVNVSLTVQLLPASLAELENGDKLHLLHYVCCHDDAPRLLRDQVLLPLQDGSFGTFKDRKTGCPMTYFCREELVLLFPGLESRFCRVELYPAVREHLHRLVLSGNWALCELKEDSPDIPMLLKESLQTRFGSRIPSLPMEDLWIRQTWTFLASTEPWCRDLRELRKVSLLPVSISDKLTLKPLNDIYVCTSVRSMPPLNGDLVTCLEKLGVTVLSELPDYILRHGSVLGEHVQYPSTQGILYALGCITQDVQLRDAAIRKVNAAASKAECTALIDMLKDSSDVSLYKSVDLLRRLKLFPTVSNQHLMSINEVREIVPDNTPPVLPKREFLSACCKQFATSLGAKEVALERLVKETLQLMNAQRTVFTDTDRLTFMKYFLSNNSLVKNESLVAFAKQVKFVPNKSREMGLAKDYYDPSSKILQELFCSEDRFPGEDFMESSMLEKLRKLGLRAEQNVKDDDLVISAKLIEQFWTERKTQIAEQKAAALLNFLETYGQEVSTATLKKLSQIRCLSCLKERDKPTDFPSSLPFECGSLVYRPSEMCKRSSLHHLGSVMPVMKHNITDQLADSLQIENTVRTDNVLDHLRNIVQHFHTEETPQIRFLLNSIFKWLSESGVDPHFLLKIGKEKCVLAEAGEEFCQPKCFWVQRADDDIDLKPYRFPLPRDMLHVQDILAKCGSRKKQDNSMLKEILSEISDKHASLSSSDYTSFRKDLQLVGCILDVLAGSQTSRDGNVLLPIYHNQGRVLRFKSAKDCTVGVESVAQMDDRDMYYVHPDIHEKTALALGALKIKDRALVDVEELDYGYCQKEELIMRLHNLLEDSYTDGFSVPKELIQNADDAGATEIFFLLDERENLDSRTNLISDNMACLQGPALCVYNNAVFSKQDFENITKLGAGTKKHEASKIGKFGLGFNTVYNLTDVPCFISNDTMAMFDPQVKYLKGPGLKLDFTRSANRALLSRMPQQFQPLQNVFGCRLENESETNYKGTLFRFPFRTQEQAKESKIKAESYSENKQREFLRMLLERAGNLLMFTQNVRNLKVFFLPNHCDDPSTAQCLLTASKSSQCQKLRSTADIKDQGILQYCANQWPGKDIHLVENVQVDIAITEEAGLLCNVPAASNTTQWRIAWVTGSEESVKRVIKKKGMIPLAAVATLLDNGTLKTVKDSPPGFYDTGHLFCFMPLPEETVHADLPVHINATFALASSRRNLLMQTEDDLNSEGAKWNSALFSDAASRAYFMLLESLQPEVAVKADLTSYFALWPATSELAISENFYRKLVSANNKLLPVTNTTDRWVSFRDAWILDQGLRSSECGEIAWNCLKSFHSHVEQLVDLPKQIQKSLEKTGQSEALASRVVSEVAFYREVFFPNIGNSWWVPEDRDRLILHALTQDNIEIHELVKSHRCIPCSATKELKHPCELIHPEGKAARLYSYADGRFPQDSEISGEKTGSSFCSHSILERLLELGMRKDNLPWDMVLERATSVSGLHKHSFEQSCMRAAEVISYLSSDRDSSGISVFVDCPANVLASLQAVPFLPVLHKPDDWFLPWRGEEQTSLFAAPKELYSQKMRDIVACKVKLLDSDAVGGSVMTDFRKTQVLKTLGVVLDQDAEDFDLLGLVAEQLLSVMAFCEEETKTSRESVQSVIMSIYTHLTKCLQSLSRAKDVKKLICNQLQGQKVVWTGTSFVSPTRVAFENEYDCRPFLFQLESTLEQFKPFFEIVGVKERFDVDDVLSILCEIKEESKGEQMPADLVDLVSRAAQLLCAVLERSEEKQLQDTTRTFLPDRHGTMLHVSHLCLDDCDWLTESESMKFVHCKISPATAKVLGVRTKQRLDYDALVEFVPFGQHEELTTRIKRLLEGYKFDSSIFKELLQNADDAGATEVKFIKDLRTLSTEKVPIGWKNLQGPALCVYNNASFSARDMEGIQNLGQGSKSQDTLKTGQYGVGFTAVYHITDVPSFWTVENDTEEVLCVLDPNCQYIPDRRPGVKMTNIDRVREAYPDMFSGYLPGVVDMTQSGTLFRLPLRTKEMAQNSRIKDKSMDEKDLTKLLEQFRFEMRICLLFLNKIRSVGVYTVNQDGTVISEYEVTKHENFTSSQCFLTFQEQLAELSEQIKVDQADLKDIEEFEVSLEVILADTMRRKEQWLVVHHVGFNGFDKQENSTELINQWKKDNFRLLPRGGVAVKLDQEVVKPYLLKSAHPRIDPRHKIFCTLPLPVHTELPMHVNGNFALSHETRTNLYIGEGTAQSQWNLAIALNVIVPAYLAALQHVKDVQFPLRYKANTKTASKLDQFFKLFPETDYEPMSKFSKTVTERIYQKMAEMELPLFPVKATQSSFLEWIPAVREEGFAGYFCSEYHLREGTSKSFDVLPAGAATTGMTESCIPQAKKETEGLSSSHSRKLTTAAAKLVKCGRTSSESFVTPPKTESDVSVSDSPCTTFGKSLIAAKKQTAHFLALLKELNMKVLDAPYRLYKNFIKYGREAKEVSPETVLEFLKSADQGNCNGCVIGDLPKPVARTPLSTVDNVKMLVKYVEREKTFQDNLEGLPLCLRQSENLYYFKKVVESEKPILSDFYHLLPGSSNSFLHKGIQKYFSVDNQKEFVKEMNILTFAELLPETLTDPRQKSGVPCDLALDSLPSPEWIKNTWRFLEAALNHERDQVEGCRPTDTECKLKCLEDWNLIPVTRNSQQQLYPVKQLHSVVYVAEEADYSNPQLQNILKNLPLAFLNMGNLPSNSILTKLVASISIPRALLHALANSCGTPTGVSVSDAFVILKYFDDNFPALMESCNDEMKNCQLKCDLKKLPFFCAVDGSTISSVPEAMVAFCLEPSIPAEGLLEWSRRKGEPVVVLCEQMIPPYLQEYLGISSLTTQQFYCEFLLPTLDTLPRDAMLLHMVAIRKHLESLEYCKNERIRTATTPAEEKALEEKRKSEVDEIVSLLKTSAFIEKEGKLHKANAFFSPHHPVFKAMCPEKFPPEPYCQLEWKSFLQNAGITDKVTEDIFVEFALSLAAEGSMKSTDKQLLTKSKTLTNHLFKTKDFFKPCVLNRVRSIRFVRPSKWRSDESHKHLLEIVEPEEPDRLVSFSESCWEKDLYLVWSCSPVLHVKATNLDDKKRKQKLSVMHQLGLSETAPKEKVFQHVHILCQTLCGNNGENLKSPDKLHLIECIMDAVYHYLQDEDCGDVSQLSELPIILNTNKLLKPQTVIIDLQEDEAIPAYIHEASRMFGRYFELFKRLGVSERVTANHYAVVLGKLSDFQMPLHVEELKMARKAVKRLFLCLQSRDKKQRNLSVAHLYLPSKNRLFNSTELVFVDDEDLWKRLNEEQTDMKFFSFEDLNLQVAMPLEEIKRLPHQHQMGLLSSIVKEFVPDEIKQSQNQNTYCRYLTEKLRDPSFTHCVIRLAYHQYKPTEKEESFSSEFEQKVEIALGRITVKAIPGLLTVLERSGKVIDGSQQKTLSFSEKGKEYPATCTVYVDANVDFNSPEKDQQPVFKCLANAVRIMVGFEPVYIIYVMLMCENISNAERMMNLCKILHYNTRARFYQSLIPNAGEYIPVCHQCYLDNSFSDFYPGEHVGFEIYDALIESEGSEDSDVGYIYAIVQNKIQTDARDDVPHLGTRYRINLGPGRGTIEVSMTQLYKFIRRTRQEAAQALEIFEGKASFAEAKDGEPAETLSQVLEEIRNILNEAWRDLDENGRTRVVKRLYLKWHPDKNKNREEFATRVVQILQHYVELLKQGKTLPADEMEDEFRDTSSEHDTFTSSFFAHMHERGRAYNTYFESDTRDQFPNTRRGRGRNRHANPQPTEGRRWLRQAEADVTAARAAKGTCDRGRNWICNMCHQAVEKALKAILYHRDARGSIFQTSNLPEMALAVGDDELREIARKIVDQVGHHARMCYPDLASFPDIPADLYSDYDVTVTMDLAERAVERARTVMLQ